MRTSKIGTLRKNRQQRLNHLLKTNGLFERMSSTSKNRRRAIPKLRKLILSVGDVAFRYYLIDI